MTIQKDFVGLQKSADRNLIKFKPRKCQVLPLGQNNPTYQYRLGTSSGKQIYSKGPENPDGHQADHEPANVPFQQRRQQYPGLH